jgi:hypothetical protein
MKKYTIFNLAALALLIGTFVACEYSQDVDPVVSPDGNPKITFSPEKSYTTVKEGDTVIYNMAIDKMLDRALTFTAHVVAGTGDANDFEVTPGVITPYTTTASVMVIFSKDWDAEPTETISLEFGVYSNGEKYLVHPTTVYPILALNVENYISDELIISIGWEQPVLGMEAVEKSVTLDNGQVIDYIDSVENEYDAADMMDFDILISPAGDFDPADPWASEMGNYSAATGANPETMTTTLEDGEYILWADLWVNDLYNTFYAFSDSTIKVPLTANFQRQGTALNANVLQDEAQAPYAYTPGADDGGGFDGVIAKIVVANGVYTIVDYEDDSEYGAGRKSARELTARPSGIKK